MVSVDLKGGAPPRGPGRRAVVLAMLAVLLLLALGAGCVGLFNNFATSLTASRRSTAGVPMPRCTRSKGFHSSTFRLNLSALYGIGGARGGGVARVKGALGGV